MTFTSIALPPLLAHPSLFVLMWQPARLTGHLKPVTFFTSLSLFHSLSFSYSQRRLFSVDKSPRMLQPSGHGLQQAADRHHHNHNTYKSSQHAQAVSAKPSPAPRPQSSTGVTSERPPSQLGVAWAADSASKPRQVPLECNHGNSNHVEDVGKSLDSMRISRDKKRSIHYVWRGMSVHGNSVTLAGVSWKVRQLTLVHDWFNRKGWMTGIVFNDDFLHDCMGPFCISVWD